jgi:DNA ligase-1
MNDTCDSVIRSLESHPSRLNKEAILEAQAEAGNTELFEGIRLALDCMVTFGVKKVPSHSGPDGQGLPWAAFRELAELLSTRQLTGNDARAAIELALSASKQSEWNDWYRRILIKDLRCGVSDKTVNKVTAKKWPEYSVPVFSCQLAHDSANHESKVAGKKLIEVKLDGVRVLTIVYPDGRVDQFSRNGKELVNFEHICQQFAAIAPELERAYVFDGEVVSSSFQALMKQVHRKDNVQAADATLMLFDVIPLSEFRAGVSTLGQQRRSRLLQSFGPLFVKCNAIDIIEQELVDLDTFVGELRFKEINQDAINRGLEGIMIKDPAALYECKRSVAWLKMKPYIEVSLTVTAVEEGTGKNAGRMGALVCAGEDDGKTYCVNVGSGFSDEQRDEIWQSRDAVVGQVVEIRADAATRSQDSETVWSLRFPRFRGFRGFVAGEKI